ncbi:MAG: cytochrome c biogenesis protein CcsA [Anaerolineae bacterium]|nr:cytochrome c biogenesis protein CcsA [Anaerolineae bacterium]
MTCRDRKPEALIGLSALAMELAIVAALVHAPTERVMGPVQRIFYFHVPAAAMAFVAFGVTFGASVAYLAAGHPVWDAVACAAAEIGELLAALVLLTGMLWAHAAWNTWWTWDPRLTTMLVLWLIYAGYLLIRRSVEDEARRARYAAVVGIIGFADVPIVVMSIRWWRTIHPAVFDEQGVHMESRMLVALLVSLVAFAFLFVSLLVARVRLSELRDEVESLRRSVL